MHVSLRPHVIAGTAALVGASAIAITPITQPNLQLPSLHAPSVALTTFDQPIAQILGTLDLVQNDLFNSQAYYPVLEGAWNGGNGIIQGVIPQFTYDALPIIATLSYNGSEYISNSINQLFTGYQSNVNSGASTAVELANALWTFLPNLVSNPSTALPTLLTEISYAGQTALAAGQYVLENVVQHVKNLITQALPSIATTLASTAIGAAQVLIATAVTVGQQFVNGLGSIGSGQSWNALVGGLLGPNGIPGKLEQLTLGPGVGVSTPNYVPSFRVWLNGAVYTTANALGGNFPPPAAAVAAAKPAAAKPATATATATRPSKPATATVPLKTATTPSNSATATVPLGTATRPSKPSAAGTKGHGG